MAGPRRLPRVLVLAALAVALPPVARAGPPDGAERAAADLEAPRWEVRRAAERALLAEGSEAMQALAADGTGRERVDAWSKAVEARLLHGEPGTVEAIRRVLRRVEAGAPDDQVRLVPRLLRARLERLLPQSVSPAGTRRGWRVRVRIGNREVDVGEEDDAPETSAVLVRGLLPEARPELVALIREHPDPRTVAGAMLALCEENGGAPSDDAALSALVEAWDADPARMEGATAFEGPHGLAPSAVLSVALALSGRSKDLARLRARPDRDPSPAFARWLGENLVRRGQGDVAMGEFVRRLDEGRARAEDEAEAARRALGARLPWLARLAARRALFLDPSLEAARATLVQSDGALGLGAQALADAGTPAPADAAGQDDAEARSIDEALRAGRLSQRLLHRIPAGQSPFPGLVPCALGRGVLVIGRANGRVALVDPATGEDRASETTAVARPPRGVAISGGVVAAVTARGGVYFWSVKDGALERLATAPGPYYAVAAGADGAFWFLAAQRTVHRCVPPAAPEPVKTVAPAPGWAGGGLAVLAGGDLLLTAEGRAVRVDPATGRETPLAPAGGAVASAAPFGDGVLLARTDGFEWHGPDGSLRGDGRVPDSEGDRILGIAGDPATGTVYLTLPDALVACAAEDGAVRWIEHLSGSGGAVVGGGLVVLPAGLGSTIGGDGRAERVAFVLRATVGGKDPFGPSERVRAVDLAVAAAEEGRVGVAEAILDPVRGWLSPAEAWGAGNALRQAEAKARREGRLPAAPPGPREPGDPPQPDDGEAPSGR